MEIARSKYMMEKNHIKWQMFVLFLLLALPEYVNSPLPLFCRWNKHYNPHFKYYIYELYVFVTEFLLLHNILKWSQAAAAHTNQMQSAL